MKCLPVPGHVTFENRPRILMRAEQCLDREEAGEKGLWRRCCYFSKYSDTNREAL